MVIDCSMIEQSIYKNLGCLQSCVGIDQRVSAAIGSSQRILL